jgi:hypothetical protein
VPDQIDEFEAWQVQLHGHRVIYHMAGGGPARIEDGDWGEIVAPRAPRWRREVESAV